MDKVNQDTIRAANKELEEFKAGKANLDRRIIENEDWWKLLHRRYFKKDPSKIYGSDPTSAWLFNSVTNKHADIMDNFPAPVILPRERTDEQVAKMLSDIIPVIIEQCEFEEAYSDNAFEKIKNGTAVYSVLWDSTANNGVGEVAVKALELLRMYWEPGIMDIQKSKAVYILDLVDNDALYKAFPDLQGKLAGTGADVKKYNYDDTVDTTNKSIVVDRYYKADGVLHYMKYVGENLLFASENDEMYANGFYADGQYPIVFDTLFPEKGTPCGFGYLDVMKSPQEYIDKLGGAMLDNALWMSKPRYFSKQGIEINEKEFLNIEKPLVHCAGSVNDDNVKPITVSALPASVLTVYEQKIAELKETSGNRDFAQGATTSGVTAASAISILTENSSKGSRDLIKGSYRAFSKICAMIIERIRQFYDVTHTFRITADNGQFDFVDFNNAMMQGAQTTEFGQDFATKAPVYDIKVKAQKANPYAQLSQNELALQFYNAGFFNPQFADQALATIEMMEFEGKEKVKEHIQQNGVMAQKLAQYQSALMQAGQIIAETTGDTRIMQMMAQESAAQPLPKGEQKQPTQVNSIGQAMPNDNSTASKAKRMASEATTIK